MHRKHHLRRLVIRWKGVVKPGTVYNQMFAALDWLPTLVEIAGGPKGKYPGILKTKLDGVNQIDDLTGKSEKSPRDTFFYYTMPGGTPAGGLLPPTPYKCTQVQNILRDPFEQNVGLDQKGVTSRGGSLAAPSTAYLYDWNLLPIGQMLWEKNS